jgi:hypothetical protein
MRVINSRRSTAIKGTVNQAKASFSTEIFAGEIISVVQKLALLRYVISGTGQTQVMRKQFVSACRHC